jgi:hypothetical protein
MKSRLFAIAGIFLALGVLSVSEASRLPVRSATPTGCASGEFDVVIKSTREWGVVPFTAAFTVAVVGAGDSIQAVQWSFGDGEPVMAVGEKSARMFTEPIDYQVTAHVVTAEHGVLTRQVIVSGYSGVMSLTFDDGHKTVLTDAMPLLASYGVTATAYIVPSWTQIDPDEYMTWDNIETLQEAGWDIGSHGMTHHKLTEVDPADLDWEIRQSQAVLRSRGFPARSFSFPHEAYNQTVMRVVKQYYESCKTDKGLNPDINSLDPYMIRSQTSLSWRPFSFYKAHIDSVLETGGCYVLNNHVLKDDCGGGSWCVTAAQLAQVIEYARANRVKVANIQEVMDNRTTGIPLGEEGMDAGVARVTGDEERPPLEILSAPQLVSHAPAEIRYYIAAPGDLMIGVFDVMGRRISSLPGRGHEPGEHTVYWDGRSGSGNPVASGHYFVVFTLGGEFRATTRITVVR